MNTASPANSPRRARKKKEGPAKAEPPFNSNGIPVHNGPANQ